MITVGMKLRFKPAGQPDLTSRPDAGPTRKVTGRVVEVHPHNCTVEWQEGACTLRESFPVRDGVLADRSVEVVR